MCLSPRWERPDFTAFFLVLGVQVFTGVQVFGLWEYRYSIQRAEPSIRGTFKVARWRGAAAGIAMLLIGVGGWTGFLSPIGAIVGGLTFPVWCVWIQLAWQQAWQVASGVTP